MRRALFTATCTVIIGILIGICSISTSSAADDITIAGSTTFAPLIPPLTKSFTSQHPSAKINFVSNSADEAMNALLDGKASIACIARYIRPQESDRAAAKNTSINCGTVGIDGVVPIIHPSNNVKPIGVGQLSEIYEGHAKNWNTFTGGADSKINVITREQGSAMDGFWKEKVVDKGQITQDAVVIRSNPEIVEKVAGDPSAIGYTSISLASDPRIKLLSLNGVQTTTTPAENHLLARKLLMCTSGKLSPSLQEFMDFMGSPEAKQIVKSVGFVPQ